MNSSFQQSQAYFTEVVLLYCNVHHATLIQKKFVMSEFVLHLACTGTQLPD
jgi:hypothetical protein